MIALPATYHSAEQAELLGLMRRTEMLGRERPLVLVEAELGTGVLEAPPDHPGIGAGAGHALAEARVVVLAAAHVADQLHDVLFAVWIVGAQPLDEQVAHFERQAKQHIARALHARE